MYIFNLVSDQRCLHGQRQNPPTDRQRQAGRRRLQTEVSYSSSVKRKSKSECISGSCNKALSTVENPRRRLHHTPVSIQASHFSPAESSLCVGSTGRGNGQNRFLLWSRAFDVQPVFVVGGRSTHSSALASGWGQVEGHKYTALEPVLSLCLKAIQI